MNIKVSVTFHHSPLVYSVVLYWPHSGCLLVPILPSIQVRDAPLAQPHFRFRHFLCAYSGIVAFTQMYSCMDSVNIIMYYICCISHCTSIRREASPCSSLPAHPSVIDCRSLEIVSYSSSLVNFRSTWGIPVCSSFNWLLPFLLTVTPKLMYKLSTHPEVTSWKHGGASDVHN